VKRGEEGIPMGWLHSRLNKEQKSLGFVYIPYVKGVSEKFKCIENRCNIRMIFKPSKDTLRKIYENEARKRSATDGTVHLQYPP
jgi:hypothetical protein